MTTQPKSLYGPYDNLEDANKALKLLEKTMENIEARLKRMYQMLIEQE